MDKQLYDQLNKAWKSTCKVLLGEEIGELKEYEEWLRENIPVFGKRKSYISGKEVILSLDEYCKKANFVSLGEIKEKTIDPLTINEIKDIDRIVEAISDKWEYTGNKILGKSSFIDSSDLVFDSHYVLDSTYTKNSSFIFGSEGFRENSKYVFGSIGGISCEFMIHLYGGTKLRRCFEISQCLDSSDLFFCMNCVASNDLLFSFNQKNKRNMIGNLQLSQEKYLSIKNKIIGEVKEELKKNKRFPSLFEMKLDGEVPGFKKEIGSKKEIIDIMNIEKAFSATFKVIFKREVNGIEEYERWLSKHFNLPKRVVSPLGNTVFTSQTRPFEKVFSFIPENRTIGYIEETALAELHLEEKDINNLNNIKKNLGKIAYFCLSFKGGNASNNIETAIMYDSSNTYKTNVAMSSEYVGVSSHSGENVKYVFGIDRVVNSEFCINCYYSSNLTRSYEIDSSINCSDSMFCHNCEGLSEAMFCFNTKAKRFAIGNFQLPQNQYKKIKDMLVKQMADEIIKNKELKYDIFNIGCYGK